jgi:hypothetical protein
MAGRVLKIIYQNSISAGPGAAQANHGEHRILVKSRADGEFAPAGVNGSYRNGR